MGQDPGVQRAPQGPGAGIGRADSDDPGALLQGLHGDLDGEVLIGLDHHPRLIEIVGQHPAAGMVMLQQAAIPHQRGKIRAGGVVADVHQSGVHLPPLPADLAVDLCGAQQPLFLQALRQSREIEKVGRSPQLLGHQADILIGLVIPGRDVGVAHQRADVADDTVPLGIPLQPGHQLADEIAPAHSQTTGTDLPQQLHSAPGEALIGLIVLCPALYQD